MTRAAPTISAVMPAYRAAAMLPRVLAPLLALRDAGEIEEVIVVDDASPDAGAAIAEALGARVIRAERNRGPGAARNLGARAARGDIVWMVDCDVIAHPDGPRHILAAFAEPGVRAVFGSYDAQPDARAWFSRYKNLMHRYHHQHARREARTFWAGCGAVDRRFLLGIRGFDAAAYRVPSIEDIELGYRIRRHGGRIVLAPALLGTHLKAWTIGDAVRTDVFRRALPWARLMIAREGIADDLNTGGSERIKALAALGLVAALVAVAFAPRLWPFAVGAAAIVAALNARVARYLHRHGGARVAIGGVAFQQLYYLYAAASFAWCLFEFHVLRARPLGS